MGWDEILERARRYDATARPGEWPPPICVALVSAAFGSALRRFLPVWSMSAIWFHDGTGPDDPRKPAAIGVAGPDPDEYVVWWDEPGRGPVIQLLTTDPQEAVALAVLLNR
ncbi:hypothetical protein KZZ52_22260 [Dactylosporangium sp. AC04546]|uniref:hypothetical protein n=1 Tax=Dactylosporangium sp. AC04546 TaxID=2862460 RepID=UPI001EE0AEFB|nr:hypothetical protein [Dactylosporangium sp. AC04546]WVK88004.1 hypothetical protein KZZ52_22260 [Dactylosporangium sp. AC04546]